MEKIPLDEGLLEEGLKLALPIFSKGENPRTAIYNLLIENEQSFFTFNEYYAEIIKGAKKISPPESIPKHFFPIGIENSLPRGDRD